MKQLAIISMILLTPTWVEAGECQSDTDCKGNRVCYKSRCLSPTVAEKYELEEFEKSRSQDKAPPPPPESGAAANTPAPSRQGESVGQPGQPTTFVTDFPDQTPQQATPPPTPQGVVVMQATQLQAIPDPDNLGPNQSAISVVLKKPAPGAVVYVDGQQMGPAPWRGVVAPGEHEVRVEAPQRRPKTKSTKVWPGRARTLEIRLRKEGNYVPFGVMVATSTVTLTFVAIGAPLFAVGKNQYEHGQANYKSWAACMGVNLALFAISLPITILFGIHPDWFGKKKNRQETLSLAPILGSDEQGLFIVGRF